jgi:hypothetical protein
VNENFQTLLEKYETEMRTTSRGLDRGATVVGFAGSVLGLTA